MIDLKAEFERMRQGVDACDHGIPSSKIKEYSGLIERDYPGRHYCVIADWIWNDIKFTKKDLVLLRERNVIPAFLYSRNILLDTEERGFQSVMTSLLKTFSHNAIFETENRIYLLCGPGRRNQMNRLAYLSLISPW